MKKLLLASTVAMAALPMPSVARTVGYHAFQTSVPAEAQFNDRLAADFEGWNTSTSNQPPHLPAGPFANIPAPAWSFSAQDQPACELSIWKPLGLQPAIELRRARYFPTMARAACAHGIPVNLFDALIIQESGYNPLARSIKGAAGLTQLMPDTAKSQGLTNVWNIGQNLSGGARILKSHLAEFGRYDLALAAYNAGPGRVRPRHSVPAIAETQAYVSAILSCLERNAIHRENVAFAERQNDRLHLIAF